MMHYMVHLYCSESEWIQKDQRCCNIRIDIQISSFINVLFGPVHDRSSSTSVFCLAIFVELYEGDFQDSMGLACRILNGVVQSI